MEEGSAGTRGCGLSRGCRLIPAFGMLFLHGKSAETRGCSTGCPEVADCLCSFCTQSLQVGAKISDGRFACQRLQYQRHGLQYARFASQTLQIGATHLLMPVLNAETAGWRQDLVLLFCMPWITSASSSTAVFVPGSSGSPEAVLIEDPRLVLNCSINTWNYNMRILLLNSCGICAGG